MTKNVYITSEEHERCRRVAVTFTELYEQTDVVVVDAGRYGFVKLQFYKFPDGFDHMITYTDSKKMFDDLWQDWLDNQVLLPALGTPLEELDYEDIFKCLPKTKQKELMDRRLYFAAKAGMKEIIADGKI